MSSRADAAYAYVKTLVEAGMKDFNKGAWLTLVRARIRALEKQEAEEAAVQAAEEASKKAAEMAAKQAAEEAAQQAAEEAAKAAADAAAAASTRRFFGGILG